MDNAQEDDTFTVEEVAKSLEQRIAELPKRLGELKPTLRLEKPKLLAHVFALEMAVSECDGRIQPYTTVMAAALLLCWPGIAKIPGVPRYHGDVLVFGDAALEFLLGRGVSTTQILRVGGVAVSLCLQGSAAQQLDEARDFSEAPGEGSPSPSSVSRPVTDLALGASLHSSRG